jgi:hypothetical protein
MQGNLGVAFLRYAEGVHIIVWIDGPASRSREAYVVGSMEKLNVTIQLLD